jgi:hypothetical protein
MKTRLFFVITIVAVGVLFLLTGCASTAKKPNYTIDIPQGWRKVDTTKYLLITRDGPFVQYALVQQRPLDRPFKHTQKTVKKGMLPQEAASLVVDEISSDKKNILKLQIHENKPATIGGHNGFKLFFSYENANREPQRMVYYGFIHGDIFYNLRFNAPAKYFYTKDLDTFEAFRKSFKLDK